MKPEKKYVFKHAHLRNCMKERCKHECAPTQHKSPSVSGTPFILALSFLSSPLAPSEGQQQLYAGDKRVQRWALGSDWLAQLLRWCEDCRLRLSKGHSARGCHLVTSLPQMTVGLATQSTKHEIYIIPPQMLLRLPDRMQDIFFKFTVITS